jgi:carboxypeptidase PM20D1
VNFRIQPGNTIDDVLAHAIAVVDDPEVSVTVAADKDAINPSPVSDHRTEIFAAIGRSVRQVYPEVPVAPGMTIAGTDSKHYYEVAENLYRLQPFIFKKEDLATIHGTDEKVLIDVYVKAIQIYAQILRNTCG